MSNPSLQSSSSIAFKEWSAVCRALAAGRQAIIARKGGIQESGGEFRPEHSEFWLLPTRFHQRPEALREGDRRFFDEAEGEPQPDDRVRIELYVSVARVIELRDEAQLAALEALHVYGPATLTQRYHYRRPGLFLLAARVYRTPTPFELPVWPELAGCKTWVELPQPLPTDGLKPVLSDEEFSERMRALATAVG